MLFSALTFTPEQQEKLLAMVNYFHPLGENNERYGFGSHASNGNPAHLYRIVALPSSTVDGVKYLDEGIHWFEFILLKLAPEFFLHVQMNYFGLEEVEARTSMLTHFYGQTLLKHAEHPIDYLHNTFTELIFHRQRSSK